LPSWHKEITMAFRYEYSDPEYPSGLEEGEVPQFKKKDDEGKEVEGDDKDDKVVVKKVKLEADEVDGDEDELEEKKDAKKDAKGKDCCEPKKVVESVEDLGQKYI